MPERIAMLLRLVLKSSANPIKAGRPMGLVFLTV